MTSKLQRCRICGKDNLKQLIKYDDDYTHVRPFTRHSLETLLKDGGFSIIENLYQLRGIPGLGMIEKVFDLNLEVQKHTIANRFH